MQQLTACHYRSVFILKCQLFILRLSTVFYSSRSNDSRQNEPSCGSAKWFSTYSSGFIRSSAFSLFCYSWNGVSTLHLSTDYSSVTHFESTHIGAVRSPLSSCMSMGSQSAQRLLCLLSPGGVQCYHEIGCLSGWWYVCAA